MRSMRPLRLLPVAALVVTFLSTGASRSVSAVVDLPSRLTDQEFWQLSQDSSEPDGTFSSDNLLSNEVVFGRLVPQLEAQAKPGGVYLGVGPEQNFTYIAAMKPRMAFITDIRRGNLHVQLMYKALFELSKDRAEFVSRLFTKPRPVGLTSSSTVLEIMNAYWDAFSADEAAFTANLHAVNEHLTTTHHIPLSQADLDGVAKVYRAFYWYGPGITWSARTDLSGIARPGTGTGSYWAMMTQTDGSGHPLSYLVSEEKFAVLKDLESRNLIVPVVGNFSGPKALRAVGTYVRDRGATVSAFYLSNVESYLEREGSWGAFCGNVATFPLDDASVFIRPSATRRMTATVNTTPNTTLNGLQFATIVQQGNGTFTIVQPPGAAVASRIQILNFTPANAGVATNSATMVPPRSSPPSGPSPANDQMHVAGLVPIKGEVSGCAGK